ncbi:Flagellar biosynthesis protein FlhA [hydrothermal vent metagenome]|uniref:Flagellar biosynthesis protein FlhA n=1 Tax=hydrothermal vent metagenome TaxID=652676 RepID=A0A3B0R7D7_9ZZZZ
MSDNTVNESQPVRSAPKREIGFAIGIVIILMILFLPIPTALLDLGLALSVALSVLILMVALWIDKPLDFSAFPTVLLIVTMLRLSLNVASTRLILTNGSEGYTAAGQVIGGFSTFVMGGDFVIGLIVFAILITINFLVITKGATRIAEVGARFALDGIPGKQMAIDADLSAGLIDDKQAQARRRELEEESSFFGAMDGASKFVRGDAIAGLLITAINIFGGIIIGVTRHDMPVGQAADIFTKLSVGDGLVSQIPALIISLAAGLLVSKGGNRGSAEQVVLGQLGGYPRALFVAGGLMLAMSLVPGLPFIPFFLLCVILSTSGYVIRNTTLKKQQAVVAKKQMVENEEKLQAQNSIQDSLELASIELSLGKQLALSFSTSRDELTNRVAKMRKKFAVNFGFVFPEIELSDSFDVDAKSYQIKLHGTIAASEKLKIGELLIITGERAVPDIPGEETREPAFGMKARWVSKVFESEAKALGFDTVDPMSVMLTHLSETIRNNLAQLLSYKDMRKLLDRLDPEYQRLIDEICPAQITHSGIQAVLKLLLAERVSIRNLELILEAIAEVAPHARRPEQIVEHVRVRVSRQICGDLTEGSSLKILRLGNRWDLAFHESIKRDENSQLAQFDIEPRMIEEFSSEASTAILEQMDKGHQFVIVTAPDARPFVRMITERLFPTLPVLSQLEIARGVEIETLGSVS